MVDIVIPLGSGSILKNFELRMCLRSIEKYLSGYGKIWLVGTLPDWIQGVNHIPFVETSNISDFNIQAKITAACRNHEVSSDYVMFNDDHFLLAPFEAKDFPYYYFETLDVYLKKRGLDAYGKRAQATMKHLQSQDLPIKNFDIHTPILYNKELFLKFVSSLNWETETYIIKSLYANSLKVEGVEEPDHKINHPPTGREKVFSTYPHIRSSITRFLTEQFPKMSKYERTGI
jgi:hypothetical protein